MVMQPGMTMRRFFFQWLAPLLLAGIFFVPAVQAQAPSEPSSEEGRGPPTMQYFFATLATVLVLFTVCKPSRKYSHETARKK